MRIRNKILVIMLPVVCVVFVCLVYIVYRTTHGALERQIRARATGALDYFTAELDSKLERMEDIAQWMKVTLESVDALGEDELDSLIRGFLNTEPDAYGSAVAFEPYTFDERRAVGLYYYRAGDRLQFIDLARPSYDYPKWDWYRVPIATGAPQWSEPYSDVGGGNAVMVTYSLPFNKNGAPWGVATVDVALSKLTKIVDDIGLSENGYAFLLSKRGVFLSMRREGWKLKMTVFDAADEIGSGELKEIGRKMTAGERGFSRFKNPLDDKDSWIAYGPISTAGWSLAMVIPNDEIMSDLASLNRRVILIFVAGLAVIFAAVYRVSTSITDPIDDLTVYAKKIASGDFTAKLKETKSKDEIGLLSRAFAELQNSISGSVEELAEEKEILRLAFSQMSDGIVIAASTWRVLQFNEAASKFLMLAHGAPLLDHLDSKFESTVPMIALADLRNERRSFRLVRREAVSGIPNSFECGVSPVVGENGQVRAYVLGVKSDDRIEKTAK